MAVRQYVYRVDRITYPLDGWQFDKYDEQGWELISVTIDYGRFTDYSNDNSVAEGYIYTFRRRFDHTKD